MLKPDLLWFDGDTTIHAGTSWLHVHGDGRSLRVRGAESVAGLCRVMARLLDAKSYGKSDACFFDTNAYRVSELDEYFRVMLPDCFEFRLELATATDVLHWFRAAAAEPLEPHDDYGRLAVRANVLDIDGCHSFCIAEPRGACHTLLAAARHEPDSAWALPVAGFRSLSSRSELIYGLELGRCDLLRLSRASLARLALAIFEQNPTEVS